MIKKPNIAFIINRGATGAGVASLIQQISILKLYQETYNLIFLTDTKTDASAKFIESTAGIKIHQVIHIWDEIQNVIDRKYENWLQFLSKTHLFKTLEFEHLIIFGGLLSDAAGLTREKRRLEQKLDTNFQMQFVSNCKYLVNTLQSVSRAKELGAPVHEIIFDPCEMSVDLIPSICPDNHILYHGYAIPEYNVNRLDSLQYFLLNSKATPASNLFVDQIDFVFGFSACTKNRLNYVDKVMSFVSAVKNTGMSLEFYSAIKGLNNTTIPRSQYLSRLESAKYTLIIPAYDNTQFSGYRFIESVFYNTIPFIAEDCEWKKFADSFGIDYSKIEVLITDYSSIPNIGEQDRLALLQYFREKVLRADYVLNIPIDNNSLI